MLLELRPDLKPNPFGCGNSDFLAIAGIGSVASAFIRSLESTDPKRNIISLEGLTQDRFLEGSHHLGNDRLGLTGCLGDEGL